MNVYRAKHGKHGVYVSPPTQQPSGPPPTPPPGPSTSPRPVYVAREDSRDCPHDGVRMELKAEIVEGDSCGTSAIWQCPACKNIEVR